MLRQPDQRGEVARRQAAPLPGIQDQQPLVRGEGQPYFVGLDQRAALGLAGPSQGTARQFYACGKIELARARWYRAGTGLTECALGVLRIQAAGIVPPVRGSSAVPVRALRVARIKWPLNFRRPILTFISLIIPSSIPVD